MNAPRSHDPYRACPTECRHDLAPGVLLADLLGGDGPHLDTGVVTALRVRPAPPALRLAMARAS